MRADDRQKVEVMLHGRRPQGCSAGTSIERVDASPWRAALAGVLSPEVLQQCIDPAAWRTDRMLKRLRQLLPFLRLRPFDVSNAEGRADERHRRIALSALASALAKVLSVGTALISVPLALHYLGTERYGMWMVMSSLVAMLSFADLGIGNGVLTQVAGAHGRDDREEIRRYVSSGFFVLTAIGLAILGALAACYRFVPWHRLFNVDTALARSEAGPAMAVFIACFALAIPAGIVQRVQMGLQRGFMASLWQCLASLLGLVGVIVTIQLEAGLHWLVLAFVGGPLIVATMNSALFFGWLQRDIAPKLHAVSRSAVARVVRTGAMFLVLQIVVAVAYASDSLVIAQRLGAASVAVYAVPEKMFSFVTTVLAMVMAPLWPAYGEAIIRGDGTWVKQTLKRSFFTALSIAAVFSAVLVVIGPKIVTFWVGHTVSPPFFLLLGLGVWKVIEAGATAAAAFLNGADILKAQVFFAITTAITALFLKISFVDLIGVAGSVWGTILAYLICSAVPMIVVVQRVLRKFKQ